MTGSNDRERVPDIAAVRSAGKCSEVVHERQAHYLAEALRTGVFVEFARLDLARGFRRAGGFEVGQKDVHQRGIAETAVIAFLGKRKIGIDFNQPGD